jgi:hypothetical protein
MQRTANRFERAGLWAVAAAVLVTVAGGAGRALGAEEYEAQPSFLTLDRMDSTSRFGLQLDWAKLANMGVGDGFGTRGEVYFQYVLPMRAIGVYGQIPASYWSNFNGGDEHGVGNLDLGAYYMPGGLQTLIFRAGLTLGLASDSQGGVVSNATVAYARLTDEIDGAPRTTAARLSASAFQTFSLVFVRADLGLDIAFSTKASSDAYLHLNGALGLRVPAVDLTAELVNAGGLNGDNGLSDRFRHSLAFMLRSRGKNLFHLGLVLPLDSGARGEIWVVSLGYQRAL